MSVTAMNNSDINYPDKIKPIAKARFQHGLSDRRYPESRVLHTTGQSRERRLRVALL